MNDFHGSVGLTIGNFEGFHRGHREIVQTLIVQSRQRGLHAAVITFKEHPLKMLRGTEPERLSLPHEKLVNLKKAGVDLLLYLDFTAEFADTEPEQFLHMLQNQLAPRLLCLGGGFRFGRGNKGNIEFLQQRSSAYHYDLVVVDDVTHLDGPVSSTRIRDAVKKGDFDLAEGLLGHSYHLYVTGEQRLLKPLCMNCAFPDDGRYIAVLHEGGRRRGKETVVERVEQGFMLLDEIELTRNGLFRLQFSRRMDT
jgi:riboflavin kinase/FMN adenylyltransferase